MSLFTTIAHPGAAKAKRISVTRVAIVITTLAVGVAVGLAIDEMTPANAGQSTAANGGALAHEDFLQINTTDLEYATPAAATNVAATPDAVDPFIHWNTTALDYLAPAADPAPNAMSAEFMDWNVGSLEFTGGTYAEQPGPR